MENMYFSNLCRLCDLILWTTVFHRHISENVHGWAARFGFFKQNIGVYFHVLMRIIWQTLANSVISSFSEELSHRINPLPRLHDGNDSYVKPVVLELLI